MTSSTKRVCASGQARGQKAATWAPAPRKTRGRRAGEGHSLAHATSSVGFTPPLVTISRRVSDGGAGALGGVGGEEVGRVAERVAATQAHGVAETARPRRR